MSCFGVMINMAQIPTPRISTDSREGAREVFSWEYKVIRSDFLFLANDKKKDIKVWL